MFNIFTGKGTRKGAKPGRKPKPKPENTKVDGKNGKMTATISPNTGNSSISSTSNGSSTVDAIIAEQSKEQIPEEETEIVPKIEPEEIKPEIPIKIEPDDVKPVIPPPVAPPQGAYPPNYGNYPGYENYNQYGGQNNYPPNDYNNQSQYPPNYNYQNQQYGGYNAPPPGGPPANNEYWQNNQGYYPGSSEYNQNYPDYNNAYGYQPPGFDPRYPLPPQTNSQWPQPPAITEPAVPVKIEDEKQAIVDLDTKEIKVEVKKEEIQEIIKNELEKIEDDKDLFKLNSASPVKDDGIPYDWAVELMKGYLPDLLIDAPKMQIFFCILEESMKLGDRMLVFSQSLLTLNLIEKFLQANTINGTDVHWAKNTSYYRKFF